MRADVSTNALGIQLPSSLVVAPKESVLRTRIMIHNLLGGASGQAIDVEIQARQVMHNKTNVTRIISDSLADHLNKSKKILIEIVTCPLSKQLNMV